MGVLHVTAHQHKCIHMLNVLMGRSIKTWAPLSACMPSSYATTCFNRHNTRLPSNGQTSPVSDTRSHKTFLRSGLALPLSLSGVHSFGISYQTCKAHQVHVTRGIHTSLHLLSSSTEPSYSAEEPDSKPEVDSDFQEIYRFTRMRGLYVLNRLKIFQSIVSVMYVPLVCYLYSLNQITALTLVGQTGITLFALVMLYYMSYYARHVVGIMYINKAEDQLKIAHLTFWGKRQDDIVQIADVMPFGEAGESRGEIVKKIKLYNPDDQFYYIVRKFGRFVNKDKFREVLGEF